MAMMITSTMPPQQIAAILRRYCDDHDIRPSRFGRDAVHDPRLVMDVQNGRVLRPGTIARLNAALNREARS
jgi:hypothetical protein